MTYKDAALDYKTKGFAPIPVHGKTPPPAGATGVDGTVTEAKIYAWMADPEWADENVALRAEGYIAIDIDAYDDKHGDTQLATLEAALGELPATWTSTARGEGHPSRQHFYAVPRGINFVGKAAPDIDIIQASHRYSVVYPSWHPQTGAQYTWYSPEEQPLNGTPSLRDFEALPAAWLEYLTVNPDAVSHTGFAGDIDTWLSDMEPGEPTTRMLNLIDGIPAEPFGHDKMLSTAFKIVRLGAEGYTGTREGLNALYAAWLRGEYNTSDNLRGINLAVQGAIKKAGARPELPNLPPFLTVANLLPASFDSRLYMDEPDIRTEQAYTGQRHALATAALTAKLDDTQTAALVWGSVAGKPLQAAPSGLRTLWAEVARAKADLPDTSLATVIPIRPVASFTAANIELLHDDERVTAAGYNWFGVEYLTWINSKPIVVNLPYHRMNRWTILSRVFSQCATIYHPAKPVGLNLYQFVVGGSSSGKTESFEFAEQVMRAYLNLDRGDRPVLADITKVSPNQLHAKLIERDGDTSLVRTDEAQAFFEQVKGSEWQRGLIDDFAKYYDGRFAAKLMANDKENSDKEAFGDLIVHFTGITEMVMQNLELSHWQSGFLLRCVWAIGNPSTPRSRSTDVEDDDETPDVLEHDKMPDQFAAKFQKAATVLTRLGGGSTKAVLRYTPEAKARHRLLENDLEDALSAHPMYESVLKDYCTRFAISVNKCAAMVAASEGVGRITVEHELVAIEQAEEWLGFALAVLAKTGNTRFDRQCQELLEFVKSKPSGRVDAVDVYRKYRPAAQADALLRQLEVEQRITRKSDVTNKSVIEIRKEAA